MTVAENQIDAFEREYVQKLREWGSYIPAEELEDLQEVLDQVSQKAEELGAQLYEEDIYLFRHKWQPLLKEVLGLIPPLLDRLNALKREAKTNMSILGQGQRGLMGYRGILPTAYSRIDSNG